MPVDSEEFIWGFPPVGKHHALDDNCRKQAVIRFDRWSLSDIEILQQLPSEIDPAMLQ
jgi:hypothetical protein